MAEGKNKVQSYGEGKRKIRKIKAKNGGSERDRTEWYNTNTKRNRDSRRIRNVLI
jgi:hypothetical protein